MSKEQVFLGLALGSLPEVVVTHLERTAANAHDTVLAGDAVVGMLGTKSLSSAGCVLKVPSLRKRLSHVETKRIVQTSAEVTLRRYCMSAWFHLDAR